MIALKRGVCIIFFKAHAIHNLHTLIQCSTVVKS